VDFDFAIRVFEGDYLEREDARRDYGEKRYLAIGEVDGGLDCCVDTARPEAPNHQRLAVLESGKAGIS
jgi:uncharacterized DUF497 family protein